MHCASWLPLLIHFTTYFPTSAFVPPVIKSPLLPDTRRIASNNRVVSTNSNQKLLINKRSNNIMTVEMGQYGSEVVSLFNNMKLPATIIAGAIVPIGILSPLPLKNPDEKAATESRLLIAMRQLYTVAGIMSLMCELISVMFSTVAVNKLIETNIAPSAGVWDLIQRDFDLPWAATNANFVMGMYGFMFMIGVRIYFQVGKGLMGRGLAGLAFSGLMLMVSVVNRGVAAGSGNGMCYGANVMHLIGRYFSLMWLQATKRGSYGPLEMVAILGLAVASADIFRGVWKRANASGSEE